MRQIVSYTTTALHELYLFFVYFEDGTIRIRLSIYSDHEAVRQRSYLIVVTNSGHRTSLRNDVLEVVEQIE